MPAKILDEERVLLTSRTSALVLGIMLLIGYFMVALNMDYFVDPELNYLAKHNCMAVGNMPRSYDRDLAQFYLLGNVWKLTLLLPATLCLAWGGASLVPEVVRERWLGSLNKMFSPRLLLSAILLLGFGLLFLRYGVLDSKHVYDDEASYYFQAQVLGAGKLFVKVPPVFESVFSHPMAYIQNGKWMSQYTNGHPFLLMLGLKVGWVWCVPFFMALCIVWLVYKIGEEIFPAKVALLGAVLIIVSPLYLWNAATIMNHVSTLFFLCLFLLAYLKTWPRRSSFMWPVLAGLALGVAFYIRPQTAAGFGWPFVLLSLYFLVSDRCRDVWCRHWVILVAFCVPCAWFFISNKMITGDWLVSSYTYNGGNSLSVAGSGPGYTPDLAIVNIMRNFQRNNLWLLGWPFSMIFVFSRFLRGGFKKNEFILILPIIGLFSIYTLFSVAGVMELGGRYYFCMLPSLLLFSAAEIVDLHRIFTEKITGNGRMVLPLFVGLSIIFSGFTFGIEKVLHFMSLSVRSHHVKSVVEAEVEVPAVVQVFSKVPAGWVFGNPIPDPELRDPVIYFSRSSRRELLKALDWLEQRDGMPRNYYQSWYSKEEGITRVEKVSRQDLEKMARQEDAAAEQ